MKYYFILFIIIISCSFDCFSKTSLDSIVVSFLGCDTTAKEMVYLDSEWVQLKSGKPSVIYTQKITSSIILEEFCDYLHWKKAPWFKCIPNAEIYLYFTDLSTDTLNALINDDCPSVKYLKNDKLYFKRIPVKSHNILHEIHKQIVVKDGCVLF